MSRYDWDPEKARVNLAKHGITFAEADELASDPLAIEEPDSSHSGGEERVRIVGWSAVGQLLIVIVSVGGSMPRIISARRATKRERHAYEARS